MLTITHGHTNPPPGASDVLTTFVHTLNAADRAHVVILDQTPADLGVCQVCDPTGPEHPAAAVISWTNRLGRPVRRIACALSVSNALHEGTSDGADVTLTAHAADLQ